MEKDTAEPRLLIDIEDSTEDTVYKLAYLASLLSNPIFISLLLLKIEEGFTSIDNKEGFANFIEIYERYKSEIDEFKNDVSDKICVQPLDLGK